MHHQIYLLDCEPFNSEFPAILHIWQHETIRDNQEATSDCDYLENGSNKFYYLFCFRG